MRLFALAVTLSLAALVAASAQTATPFQISPKDLQRVLDGRLGLYPALPRMERLCPMHASYYGTRWWPEFAVPEHRLLYFLRFDEVIE